MTWKMQEFEQRDVNAFLKRTDLPSVMREFSLGNDRVAIFSQTPRGLMLNEPRTTMTWEGIQRLAIAAGFLILVLAAGLHAVIPAGATPVLATDLPALAKKLPLLAERTVAAIPRSRRKGDL